MDSQGTESPDLATTGTANAGRGLFPVLLIVFLLQPVFSQQPTTPTTRLEPGVSYADPFLDGSGRRGPQMIYIGEQTFVMGSRPDEPGFRETEIQHEVSLSSYSLGVYEITNAELCEFLNEEGNQLDDGILWVLTNRPETCLIREENGWFVPVDGAADRPAVAVSWNAARAYSTWLSKKTGKTYRLPTEAEWECGARAGTETIWPWGDDFAPARLHWASSPRNAGGTIAVGSYPANPWGLHDMLGNVWEWVIDCTEEDFYFHSPSRDPVLFDDDCWTPGIRGGSFTDGPGMCRPGFRVNTWWWGEYPGVGFRVVRDEAPARRRHLSRPKRGS